MTSLNEVTNHGRHLKNTIVEVNCCGVCVDRQPICGNNEMFTDIPFNLS